MPCPAPGYSGVLPAVNTSFDPLPGRRVRIVCLAPGEDEEQSAAIMPRSKRLLYAPNDATRLPRHFGLQLGQAEVREGLLTSERRFGAERAVGCRG